MIILLNGLDVRISERHPKNVRYAWVQGPPLATNYSLYFKRKILMKPTSLLSAMFMKEYSEKSLKTENSITRTEKESLISPRYVNIWFAPTLKLHLFFVCYTVLPSLLDTPLQGANVYFHPWQKWMHLSEDHSRLKERQTVRSCTSKERLWLNLNVRT